MHFPPKFLQKRFPPTFSMVHLLHRLYGVDAPVRYRGITWYVMLQLPLVLFMVFALPACFSGLGRDHGSVPEKGLWELLVRDLYILGVLLLILILVVRRLKFRVRKRFRRLQILSRGYSYLLCMLVCEETATKTRLKCVLCLNIHNNNNNNNTFEWKNVTF